MSTQSNKNNEPAIEPLLITIVEAAQALGICRAGIYRMIANQDLEIIRIGRSVRIPVSSVRTWVEKRQSESKEGK